MMTDDNHSIHDKHRTMSWDKVPGNTSMIKLHPLMLSPEGHTIPRRITYGAGYYDYVAQVIYDRDYVLKRFNDLLDQLQFKTPSDCNDFLEGLRREI